MRERGAALVEFALVSPLLFLVLFGIVEFGYQFNNYQSVRSGAREAARQGAVTNFGTTSSCGLTGGTSGSASTDMQNLMCFTKSQIGLGNGTRVKIMFALPDLSAQDTFKVANALIICAEYPMQSFTGIFNPILNGGNLKTKTTIRIEQAASGSETSGYESEPSGSTAWSWCTTNGAAP